MDKIRHSHPSPVTISATVKGSASMRKKTARFFAMKRKGQPIAALTGYDAPTAKAEEAAGVDIILVGDSVGTNILGYASERDVTLADMCHHVGAVRRGAPKTTIIADLPYRSYDTPEIAVKSSSILIETGADIVKFEGARSLIVEALAMLRLTVSAMPLLTMLLAPLPRLRTPVPILTKPPPKPPSSMNPEKTVLTLLAPTVNV